VSIKKAVKEIKFELSEIESLFDLYKEELFELNRVLSAGVRDRVRAVVL
jgi:hypothetical protein